MAVLPVIVIFGVSLEHATLDDPVLELVESDLDVMPDVVDAPDTSKLPYF